MLRKLDFPVEDIKEVLEGNTDFTQAVRNHLDSLKERKKELSAQINFLEKMEREGADLSNQERYLRQMEQEERQGRRFTDILEDYKRTAREESRRKFSFVPDTMARTPREFTEELLRFADQEKLNLVITREGMTPLFEIDGVSYEAFRLSGRFGIVVQCQMTEPRKQETDLAQQGEEEKQKKDSAGKKGCAAASLQLAGSYMGCFILFQSWIQLVEPIDFYWNLGGSGVRLLHILEPEKLTEGDTRKNFLVPLKSPKIFSSYTADEGAGG